MTEIQWSGRLVVAGFGAAEARALSALLGGRADGTSVIVGERLASELVNPTGDLPEMWNQSGADKVAIIWSLPWDVLPMDEAVDDSVRRDDVDTMIEAWSTFHQLAVDLLDRHGERTVLVQSAGIAINPYDVLATVCRRLDVVSDATANVPEDDMPAWARVTAARAGGPPRHRAERPIGKLLDRLPLECRLVLGELEARSHWRPQSADGDADIEVDRLVPRRLPAGSTPTVSVVIPCRNEGTMLLDAIASVRLCRGDVELIVADDGSTDPLTCRLLDRISQRGVDVVRLNAENPSNARNAALATASGRFVLPLDADNLLRPGYAASAAGVLDANPDIAVVYADAERFGRASGRWTIGPPDIDRLVRGNYIDNCSVVRRQALDECGGWDEAVPVLADWDLWLGVAERSWKFHYLEEVGFDYRVRRDSLTSRIVDPGVRDAEFSYIITKHRELWAERAATTVVAFLHLADSERARGDELSRQLEESAYQTELLRARLVEVEQSLHEAAIDGSRVADLEAALTDARREAHVIADELETARDDITRRERAAEKARELVAIEQNRRLELEGNCRELERRVVEAAEGLANSDREREAALREVQAVYATKTFRALQPLRQLYGRFHAWRSR